MTNDIKKKKVIKRSEQILIDHQEKQIEFDKLIEEDRKILELTKRECDNTVNVANTRLTKTIKQIILERGQFLENNLELVTNRSANYICRVLKQKYKGYVNPSTIWWICPEKWKSAGNVAKGRKGGNLSKGGRNSSYSSYEVEPLTEYEKEFVEVHEQKVNRNEHITALINDFLGMSPAEQADLVGGLPKGTDKTKILIDNAYNNMLSIIKKLNDVDIPALLLDIRTLKRVLSRVSEMALAEHESRKKNKELMSK